MGRERELVLSANQVLGSASSRAIVQVEYGVGKTSFTNRLKTALAGHRVLTHARPVRVIRDLRAREFEAGPSPRRSCPATGPPTRAHAAAVARKEPSLLSTRGGSGQHASRGARACCRPSSVHLAPCATAAS